MCYYKFNQLSKVTANVNVSPSLQQYCSVIDHRRWIFPCDESDNKIGEVTQEAQTQQPLVEKVP